MIEVQFSFALVQNLASNGKDKVVNGGRDIVKSLWCVYPFQHVINQIRSVKYVNQTGCLRKRVSAEQVEALCLKLLMNDVLPP